MAGGVHALVMLAQSCKVEGVQEQVSVAFLHCQLFLVDLSTVALSCFV